MLQRDPVSLLWEPAAAAFVEDVAAARGRWHGVRIADPEPRHIAAMAALGIDVLERDRAGRPGGLNARDRWRRGFVRAVYRAAKDKQLTRPLELSVGVKMPRRGVIPPGRPVRGRFLTGAEARRRREEQRVTGNPARRADLRERDW